MRRHWIFSLLAIAVILALLIACSPSSAPSPTTTLPTQQPTTQPTSTVKSSITPTSSPTTTATEAVKPIVLRANFGNGPKTYYWAPAYFDPWCDEIEKRSQGRIQFKRTYGSEMFGAADEWKALEQGAVDFVPFMTNAYYASMSPLFTMSQVPFLWENKAHFEKGLESGLEKVFRDAVLEKFPNTKVLNSFICPGDTHIYYKGPNIKVPVDIKGIKIRVTDAILNNFVNSVGGAGVFLPVAEAYTSLQRAIVNGALGQNTSLLTYKWYEVTDKATFLKLVYVQNAVMANKNTFDSLPADLQKIILDVTNELVDYSNYTQIDKDQYVNNVNDVLKARPDYQFMELTPAERAQWRDASKATWDYYSRLGGIATQQVINIAEQTRAEFVK